jgi:hypothetical protein
MRIARILAPLLEFAALGLAVASCRNDGCLPTPTAPCPFPLALTINVTAVPTGGPVSAAFVEVSGPVIATIPCTETDTTVCYVPGYAGKYNLAVGAPGFQRTQRSVTVQGTTPACGCATVAAEHLSVALVASP